MQNTKLAIALVLSVVLSAGCAARSSYVYPKQIQDRYVITTGDVDRPYESLGYVQLTKKGFDLFAVISVVPADLEAIFGDELVDVLAKSGADGIINVRFRERQWTPAERAAFLLTIVGIFWLPTQVELTGELIRFQNAPPQGAPGALPPAQ